MVPVVKNLPANAGDIRDVGSILGSGRSPGGGHGNLLQCSCLEHPMDRGAWQATVLRLWFLGLQRGGTCWVTHTLSYQIAAGLPVFEGFKVN